MLTKKLFQNLSILILFALLSACAHLKIENIEVCSVAGILRAGMNCANTLSKETRELTLDETIDFLEAKEEIKDENGKVIQEERGAALVMSASDFNKIKTGLEVACKMLKNACTYEVQQQIASMKENIESIQTKGKKMKTISSIPNYGDKGPDVGVIQEQLALAGFSPGKIDNDFGPKTKEALSKFQKSKGSTGTGIPGPKTIEWLGIEIKAVQEDGKRTITQDMAGKKARKLHPKLRAKMEAVVFPGGVIPKCFLDMDPQACVIYVAEKFETLKIREVGGNNRGEMVGLIQAIIGPYNPKGTGDAWCMSTDQCVIALIEDYFQIESPVLDSEHCVTTWNHAKKISGLTSSACVAGSFWLAQHGNTTSGHTGTVLKVLSGNKMGTFEGNTGDSSIRDGDGAFLRTRDQKQNGDLKTLGFVFIYPNNKLPKAA